MATRAPGRFASHLLLQTRRRPIAALPAECRPRPCKLHARSLHGTRPARGPAKGDSSSSSGSSRLPPWAIVLATGVGIVGSYVAFSRPDKPPATPRNSDDKHKPEPTTGADERDPSLPRFRLADVRKHDASSPNPWVVYEDKVYDITDWVAAHPGGDVILRAAGGSIEPYWNIFSIHKSAHVREILSQYLLGFVDVADLVNGRPAADAIEDPFESDPQRDPRLITHTSKPRNAEPPNEELDRTFRTPNDLFYIRHHMWVPVVAEGAEAEQHALTVELPDGETRSYTLAELKERFPIHRVTAVLQCSGNRRNDMTRHAGKTNGLQWGVGAISNAEWEGVRLADVLADAGLKVESPTAHTGVAPWVKRDQDLPDPNTHHVQFTGLEAYGASIPLSKAMDPRGDVLLAFGMNGQPLPRDHGFPLRAVVPGHVAARSVKWLSKIVVSDEESHTQWQRRDYKSFGPNEGANPDWDRAVSIQEMPVTSAITGVWVGECVRRGKVPWMRKGTAQDAKKEQASKKSPSSRVVDMAAVERDVGFTPKDRANTADGENGPCSVGGQMPAEPVAMQGYAYSGGGRAISRVDVSLDGGKTWDQAELLDDCATDPRGCHGNKDWSWKRWRYKGQLPVLALPPPSTADDKDKKKKDKHCTTLVVKATDEAYNTQPECHKGIYNVRGNLATAWHRVRICPRCETNGTNGNGKGVRWSTGETYGCGFKKEAEEVREGMLRSSSSSSSASQGAATTSQKKE